MSRSVCQLPLYFRLTFRRMLSLPSVSLCHSWRAPELVDPQLAQTNRAVRDNVGRTPLPSSSSIPESHHIPSSPKVKGEGGGLWPLPSFLPGMTGLWIACSLSLSLSLCDGSRNDQLVELEREREGEKRRGFRWSVRYIYHVHLVSVGAYLLRHIPVYYTHTHSNWLSLPMR